MVSMNGVFVDRYFWIERFSALPIPGGCQGKNHHKLACVWVKCPGGGAARERGRAEYTGCADLTPSAY